MTEDMTKSIPTISPDEHRRRWRLILGKEHDGTLGCTLQGDDARIDDALEALYDVKPKPGNARSAGLGGSRPSVARWLGDIRKYFPKSVVRVMQQDALKRLDMQRMLAEPEMLEAAEADVHLVATILSLSGVIPEKTKATARLIVRKVVDALMQKLEAPMKSAVEGALNRGVVNRRPRMNEIDWHRTIRHNLRHYQHEYRTIIPETLIGYGRKARRNERDIILAIDQSGSMASSVVYSSIFGAVMATLPAVRTRMVVFDTAVVDLTEKLDDPVDVLFGTQLGGGTDINKAVRYCQSKIENPEKTILVLISDLYEGGVAQELLSRTRMLIRSGVQFIVLLALSDDGAPIYDNHLAAQMTALGAPAFACTPDQFPALMAAAIKKEDIGMWAATEEIVVVGNQ